MLIVYEIDSPDVWPPQGKRKDSGTFEIFDPRRAIAEKIGCVHSPRSDNSDN